MIAQVEILILSQLTVMTLRDQLVSLLEEMTRSNQLVLLLIVPVQVMILKDRLAGLVTVHRDPVIPILRMLRQPTLINLVALIHSNQQIAPLVVLLVIHSDRMTHRDLTKI
jgi:hypothetical protein